MHRSKLISAFMASRLVKAAAFAAAALTATLLASPASAAVNGQSNVSLNVRAGPGTQYAVVDVLYAGEPIQVGQCISNGWCYITHNGPDGWVSSRYISVYTHPTPPPPPPSSSAGVTIQGPNLTWSFSFGSGNFPHYGPRICVYKGQNYTGASMCAEPGDRFRRLSGSWNNSISSVRVFGGAEVTLCDFSNYNGFCRTVTSNEPALGPWLNNKVTSMYVTR